uniref:Uncharacterized protein n=1 Tax=Lepeophtheirus salmonis TaxID=72036 RepID=A0A0K2V4Y3_LEPSM
MQPNFNGIRLPIYSCV